tara:strand:- start:288 stop:548 length:261 start_codon:yes stop_codon:yes gene_type:complete
VPPTTEETHTSTGYQAVVNHLDDKIFTGTTVDYLLTIFFSFYGQGPRSTLYSTAGPFLWSVINSKVGPERVGRAKQEMKTLPHYVG